MNAPALLARLNENNCIDTRWISSQVGKPLKHVHEDTCRIFKMVEIFDHERDSRGYVKSMWLPLAEALYLMSTYNGERAEKARALIMEAINFYLFEAPRLRAEIVDLKARLIPNTVKRLPSHRAGQIPMPMVQESMFGDAPVVRYVMRPIEGAPPSALDKARLRHMQRQMEGIAKQVNALQRRLDGEFK